MEKSVVWQEAGGEYGLADGLVPGRAIEVPSPSLQVNLTGPLMHGG